MSWTLIAPVIALLGLVGSALSLARSAFRVADKANKFDDIDKRVRDLETRATVHDVQVQALGHAFERCQDLQCNHGLS